MSLSVSSVSPVSPLGAHALLMFLLQVGVLLGSAVLLGGLARRAALPSLAGELVAGVVLGPSLLTPLAPGFAAWLLPRQPDSMHLLDAVGQLGVLLLVGITGMNVDLGLVRRKGRAAVLVSAGGLVVPFAGGLAVALALPAALLADGVDRTVFALFTGVALCVSALPVIARTLLDMGLLHRDIGQLIVGASVVDDIAGWLLLSVVSAMATTGVHGPDIVWSVVCLAGLLAGAVFLGRPLVRRLLRWSGRSGNGESLPALCTVLIVLGAAASHALHMEAIIGAFLVGVLIGSSGEADRERLAPLRVFAVTVLAPLFFATAGLRIDLTALARPEVAGSALLVLAVAIAGKFAGAYAGARAGRLGHWEGLALGAGLNSRGVIEVIIAMVGLRLGILTTEMYTIIVLVAIVTSVLAAPLLRAAVRRMPVTREERVRERVMAGEPVLESNS
ncbi:cation:proton antiporter [Streptomyces sp. NRRL S-1022]|uniref:cation:proton antiporter n=1 Tax=Streptomyces sp. NRRL S-1022 TaxID=1463880 RepID=UPI000A7604AA|nr:cation:proton antiporter [Streptomyces sp. NRRL S-1022]